MSKHVFTPVAYALSGSVRNPISLRSRWNPRFNWRRATDSASPLPKPKKTTGDTQPGSEGESARCERQDAQARSQFPQGLLHVGSRRERKDCRHYTLRSIKVIAVTQANTGSAGVPPATVGNEKSFLGNELWEPLRARRPRSQGTR